MNALQINCEGNVTMIMILVKRHEYSVSERGGGGKERENDRQRERESEIQPNHLQCLPSIHITDDGNILVPDILEITTAILPDT